MTTTTDRKKKRILFYYLSAFSKTGGIEKFNRCFIKALNDNDQYETSVVSVYDEIFDKRYGSGDNFKGFGRQKWSSVKNIVRSAKDIDVLIIGHINLALPALIVKAVNPKCRLILVGHGIEVWGKLKFTKRYFLKKLTLILAVSNFTKNRLVLNNGVSPSKIRIFPNTIDPYFVIPDELSKPQYLLDRYQIQLHQPVILTLSRLLSSERFKGYDQVIAALPEIIKHIPDVIYVLAGKYDQQEKSRIQDLISKHQLEKHVLLTGFVDEKEVTDHYRMADVFIMPSRKEGFGIVFLEALACGTNVIGGNQDGTVDALRNGSLGRLINPTKGEEIRDAVIAELQKRNESSKEKQKKVLEFYQFEKYCQRLDVVLKETCNN